MDSKDLLGFGKASEKLLEVVSNGIGCVYEPVKIIAIAAARKKEIEMIDEAISNSNSIVKYSCGEITCEKAQEDLSSRTSQRLMFQENKKQRNIEDIIFNAYENLETEENCSNEELNEEWINRFFELAGNISTEELKIIWGRILSKEIIKPGSCSIRTLEILKNLSKEEAEIFRKIADFIFISDGGAYLLDDDRLLESLNIKYGDILDLDEASLINSTPIALVLDVSDKEEKLRYGKYKIVCRKSSTMKRVSLSVYLFSRAAKDILGIITPKTNEMYFRRILNQITNGIDTVEYTDK